jgi:hypothetical protein
MVRKYMIENEGDVFIDNSNILYSLMVKKYMMENEGDISTDNPNNLFSSSKEIHYGE